MSISLLRHLRDSQGGREGGTCTTSLGISMPARTSPLRGHLLLKVERDGPCGSDGQLFTRWVPTNIDKN